jgi:hypothetical protein
VQAGAAEAAELLRRQTGVSYDPLFAMLVWEPTFRKNPPSGYVASSLDNFRNLLRSKRDHSMKA